MIVIIDYGMGNLRSVLKAFKRFSNDVIISNKTEDISSADKLVLPGVGHFKSGMAKLNELNLIDVINKRVLNYNTPVLGICLGMQLMTEFSEEGDAAGLGWINSRTKTFKRKIDLKVPNIGWNNISIVKSGHSIFNSIDTDDSFYFVHSYFIPKNNLEFEACYSNYGIEYCSGFIKNNIFGFQFHPEKSLSSGMKLINNFVNL